MKFKNASIVIAFMSAAAACSTTPPVENFSVDTNPTEEVKKLEADLDQANAAQVNVLAPKNYEQARDALKDARKSLESKDDAKEVLKEVAEGRAYLKRAQEFAKVGTDNMAEVVKTRQLALDAGAKDSYAQDFRKADDKLKDVSEDIEKNKPENAMKNRDELLSAYLDLELRGIKRKNLAEAEGLVKDADRKDAKKWAPRTYAVAQKSIDDAEAFITANRHDTAQIKVLSDKALADAQHVIQVTGSAKSGEKTTSEEAALRMEAAQKDIAVKQTVIANTQAELNKTAAVAAGAQGELAKKQAIDQKYEQARAMFSKNEAEVYRQGQAIVIRLRSLEFDTAKAQLKGNNFPVLAKVQNVIAEFPTAKVIVEGHTDSKGGKEVNEKVSQARADTVKSYLENNTKAQGAQFSAIGYGFQKPLASNKTESGRAQNRRVDIVITPENM